MTEDGLPTLDQQRAFAYAMKPFAALSFMSSAYAMYYLLILHREKLRRMYHRLMLSAFFCCASLSFALFWGTWAMPPVDFAVGESGNAVTCSIQGFLIVTFHLAFPFTYASLGAISCVALKNDFKEDKYDWMEKWIHIGTYAPPLTFATVAAVNGWFEPLYAYCTTRRYKADCGEEEHMVDPSCHLPDYDHIRLVIVFIEILGATLSTIIVLISFKRIQKEKLVNVGMMNIVQKARTQRYKDVVRQLGLYMVSFWLGYILLYIVTFVWIVSGVFSYDWIIACFCLNACQGFMTTVIYFALQRKSRKEIEGIVPGRGRSAGRMLHPTVSVIRKNAARTTDGVQPSEPSKHEYSFNIFDGCPDENSPWLAYLNEDDDDMDETFIPEVLGEETGMGNDLGTSLLGDGRLR